MQLRHARRHKRTPVAALRNIACVTEAAHQFAPRRGDTVGVPAVRGRLVRKPETGKRRRHKMKRIFRPRAVGSVSGAPISMNSTIEPGQPWVMTIAKAFGCLERTWRKWLPSPSSVVRNCLLTAPPVVTRAPIVDQRTHLRVRDALRSIIDRLALRPARARQPPLHVVQRGAVRDT